MWLLNEVVTWLHISMWLYLWYCLSCKAYMYFKCQTSCVKLRFETHETQVHIKQNWQICSSLKSWLMQVMTECLHVSPCSHRKPKMQTVDATLLFYFSVGKFWDHKPKTAILGPRKQQRMRSGNSFASYCLLKMKVVQDMHVFSLLVTSYFEFSYYYSLPVNL